MTGDRVYWIPASDDFDPGQPTSADLARGVDLTPYIASVSIGPPPRAGRTRRLRRGLAVLAARIRHR